MSDSVYRHGDGSECLWDLNDQVWLRMHPLYPVRECRRPHPAPGGGDTDLRGGVSLVNAQAALDRLWQHVMATADPGGQQAAWRDYDKVSAALAARPDADPREIPEPPDWLNSDEKVGWLLGWNYCQETCRHV